MTTPATSSPTPDSHAMRGAVAHPARKGSVVPVVAVVGVFLAIALPLILFSSPRGRWGEDQINFHEPAIRTFAQELPNPNFQDYLSATTPAYHLLIAIASKIVGDSSRMLQLVGAVFTVALLALLASACTGLSANFRGRARIIAPVAVCLPVVCSMYVLQSGAWLLPDNAGWLGVLLVLLIALRFPRDFRTLLIGGAAVATLVLFRQIHVWTAGLLWVGAWLSREPMPEERSHPLALFPLLSNMPARMRDAGVAFLVTTPALGILAILYTYWGGLTPPMFQGQYKGVNPAAPAFILAVFGVASVFFAGFVSSGMAALLTRHRGVLVLAAIFGVGVACVTPLADPSAGGGARMLGPSILSTSYSVEHGRYSGLWALATKLPLVAGKIAPAMVALSCLGAVMLAAWALSLRTRDRWLLLAAVAGFVVAQSASFQLWQRYSEPFVLMLLAVMACRITDRSVLQPDSSGVRRLERLAHRYRLAGPFVLAGLLATLAVYTMSRAPLATKYDFPLAPALNSGFNP